jgi:hypothetical protein
VLALLLRQSDRGLHRLDGGGAIAIVIRCRLRCGLHNVCQRLGLVDLFLEVFGQLSNLLIVLEFSLVLALSNGLAEVVAGAVLDIGAALAALVALLADVGVLGRDLGRDLALGRGLRFLGLAVRVGPQAVVGVITIGVGLVLILVLAVDLSVGIGLGQGRGSLLVSYSSDDFTVKLLSAEFARLAVLARLSFRGIFRVDLFDGFAELGADSFGQGLLGGSLGVAQLHSHEVSIRVLRLLFLGIVIGVITDAIAFFAICTIFAVCAVCTVSLTITVGIIGRLVGSLDKARVLAEVWLLSLSIIDKLG